MLVEGGEGGYKQAFIQIVVARTVKDELHLLFHADAMALYVALLQDFAQVRVPEKNLHLLSYSFSPC